MWGGMDSGGALTGTSGGSALGSAGILGRAFTAMDFVTSSWLVCSLNCMNALRYWSMLLTVSCSRSLCMAVSEIICCSRSSMNS